MDNLINIFDFKFSENKIGNWTDFFFIERDYEDEIYFISKEKFKYNCPEEGRVFEYRYLLSFEDIEIENNEYKEFISLRLIPTRKYINKTLKEDILAQEDITESDFNEFPYSYMIDYIEFPLFLFETIKIEDFDYNNNQYFNDIIYTIGYCLQFYNSFIGFYFDKICNAIGTTNWDLLDGVLKGINPFEKSINRLSNK